MPCLVILSEAKNLLVPSMRFFASLRTSPRRAWQRRPPAGAHDLSGVCLLQRTPARRSAATRWVLEARERSGADDRDVRV